MNSELAVDPHDLAPIVDPPRSGGLSTGEINRLETVITEQKAMILIAQNVVADDLPAIVDRCGLSPATTRKSKDWKLPLLNTKPWVSNLSL